MQNKILKPVIIFASVVLCGCKSSTYTQADVRALDMAMTSKAYESGQTITYEIGTIKVPENRTKPDSRLISLQFHRFAAPKAQSALQIQIESQSDAPPIYVLKGGPGFDGMESKLKSEGHYNFYIAPYQKIADVIVIEHRGYGALNDTPCPNMPEIKIDDVDTQAERIAIYRKGALACRDLHLSNGVDLSGYTVKEMSADIIDVANALGHDKIQLMGNSFGSHVGMSLMRSYPERIARATLTALEGPDHTFDLPLEKEAMLRGIAEDAQTALEASKPEWAQDVLHSFSALAAKFDAEPIKVETENSRTGKPVSVKIDGLAMGLVAQGFSRGTAWGYLFPTWAKDMELMLSGDLSGAARRIHRVWTDPRVENAAYFSVECSSGASDTRKKALRDQAAKSIIKNNHLFVSGVCDDWPLALNDDFRTDFVSDVPVLLMHGTYDTSTPFANAKQVQNFFTNMHFITVNKGSHGAYIEAFDGRETFLEDVSYWMQTGDYSKMPDVIDLPPIKWE